VSYSICAIRRLAVVWCRLGKVMYDDAVGREAGGGGADCPGGSLAPLLQGLLGTVQKAVDTALQEDEGVMESTLHQSFDASSDMAMNMETTVRQHNRLARRRKKLTQRQVEQMLRNTRVDTSFVSSADPKRYSIYIGLVFALALVYKLINKFEHKTEQVNLMYLLQRLRNGDDTCFKELSRDDLRGFLGDHLYVIFDQKWHKFDALCQRFDPDKKGFINHTQLQKSFRWLCPLAEPLGDIFDGQVAMQTLLSIVSLQVLSYKLELNELFRKLLIQYKSIVPTFEAFIEQKSTFSNRAPHDLRFNCDALLMADFLFVLASQYLGLECDRSQFAASINRPSGKHWKLPDNATQASAGTSGIQGTTEAAHKSSLDRLLRDDQQLYGVKFLLLNVRGVCDTVAKGLLLYDYSKLSPGKVDIYVMFCHLCAHLFLLYRYVIE
jgi:hypothetical protein